MKKYLFNGAMALIVGVFIVSCSHDDIGQISTVDEMTKSFDEMFKELYGPIAPNHNWGFNTVVAEEGEDEATETEAAGTRSTEKEDHTLAAMGLTKPTLKDGEAAYVMDWFQKNAGANSVGLDIDKFFIIFIGGNTTVNVKHHDWDGNYYNNNKNNGATSNFFDVYSTETSILDQLKIDGEHINDWNANGGVTEYVYDRTANNFIAHNSFCDVWTTKWKLAKIEYDGEEGWYVGISSYAKKLENTYETLPGSGTTEDRAYYTDYDRPEYYDDYVFKIVPANPTTPSTPEKTPAKEESKTITTNTYRKIVDIGRVFCEDIATARMKVNEDVDYNDIVFDARVWEIYDQTTTTYNGSTTTSDKRNIKYQYDISMLAAGGTIPENVGINNVDVHDAFGVGLTFMVNTWTDKSTAFGQYNTPTNVMQPKQEVISYTLDYNDSRLDKSNVGISSIPIYVKYNGQNVKALDNKNTDAPYKLCVPIGTLWPIERVNIQNAYTNFRDFVSSPSNKFYEDKGSQVSANLYTQAPTSRIQSDGWNIGYTQLVSSSSSTSKIYVVWEGDVTENNTPITLYDFNFQSGQTLRFYGSGTITVNCGASGETGLISNGSMTNGYFEVYLYPYQASQLSQGILVQGSNFRLTKIVVL